MTEQTPNTRFVKEELVADQKPPTLIPLDYTVQEYFKFRISFPVPFEVTGLYNVRFVSIMVATNGTIDWKKGIVSQLSSAGSEVVGKGLQHLTRFDRAGVKVFQWTFDAVLNNALDKPIIPIVEYDISINWVSAPGQNVLNFASVFTCNYYKHQLFRVIGLAARPKESSSSSPDDEITPPPQKRLEKTKNFFKRLCFSSAKPRRQK